MNESFYKKFGRPSAMTPETVRKLKHAFSIGAIPSEACAYAHISRSTFYKKMKEDEAFRTEIERLQHKLPLKARTVFYNFLCQMEKKIEMKESITPKEFKVTYEYLRELHPEEFPGYYLRKYGKMPGEEKRQVNIVMEGTSEYKSLFLRDDIPVPRG